LTRDRWRPIDREHDFTGAAAFPVGLRLNEADALRARRRRALLRVLAWLFCSGYLALACWVLREWIGGGP